MRFLFKSNSVNKTSPGQIVNGFVAGKVLQSKNKDWQPGDLFGARLPFQSRQIITAAQLAAVKPWKLTDLIEESEIAVGVGVLGMVGATAYGGVVDVLRPKQNEVLFVSAAAGAVGSLVGMLAKTLFDCTVIGSCGGDDRAQLVKEQFLFDHVINYKNYDTAEALAAAIREYAPNGIDMYFENVGGIHFDAALSLLRPYGRIALCGQISQYNSTDPPVTTINMMKLVYSSIRMEGLISTTWLVTNRERFLREMHEYWKKGKVRAVDTVFEGIEQWPAAFSSLFSGGNIGKIVVRV